jgi:hypothetical protein
VNKRERTHIWRKRKREREREREREMEIETSALGLPTPHAEPVVHTVPCVGGRMQGWKKYGHQSAHRLQNERTGLCEEFFHLFL